MGQSEVLDGKCPKSQVIIAGVAKHAGDGSLHGAPESLGHRVLLLCVWGGEALGDAILIAPVGEVAFRVLYTVAESELMMRTVQVPSVMSSMCLESRARFAAPHA